MKTRFECLPFIHLFHSIPNELPTVSQTLFQVLEINLMDKIDTASKINNNNAV